MSSHFKYEIDERNLRLQLKENEFSFSEEAWQKFENFTASQKNNANDAIIKRFQLTLNRNVVLPVVFAVVIIMFSLLLFNFINIKNPNKESVTATPAVKETPAVVTPPASTPPKQEAITPVITETIVPEQQANPALANVVEKTEAENQVSRTPVIKAVVVERSGRERNTTEEEKSVEQSSENTTSVSNVTSEDVTVKRKRRNKRENVVTEPTQEEADQLPPPVSEETPQ